MQVAVSVSVLMKRDTQTANKREKAGPLSICVSLLAERGTGLANGARFGQLTLFNSRFVTLL